MNGVSLLGKILGKVYTENDANLDYIRNKKIAILGYGSQGRAWALNLRDSGLNVHVGLERQGNSWRQAVSDGITPEKTEDALKDSDIVIFLVPDMVQRKIYTEKVMPVLRDGMDLVFAHGFNIHYKLIVPPENVDVYMAAPKAPGPSVREFFVKGGGVPVLVGVHQDHSGNALNKALAIAKGLGATKAGVLETSFREETETDLMGEQLDLVGGLTAMLRATFQTIVDLGYRPEMAYFEAINEMKLITDQIYDKGLSGMLRAVSDTAKYGGLTVGPYIINDEVKKRMREKAEMIRSGKFASEWIEEYDEGSKHLQALMDDLDNSLEEQVGRELREIVLRGRPKN
ncbi:ketol-acid reductoisomerase [Acidiplasma aeolicum]|jgi:ketol-acid reductoisomerase|uniref:Ketol-acid reductoisomerase (NADP(+)) n=1 Tax=Acidiplasma aeolicum TaxID=507754 RepID=A0A0N8VKH0_9ARCH|nr:ketol-acid reductoisomerase [Acidiplasma aeolicum]KQB33700.1 ketol-acid reductoisomerase [Acidiplasma aeolicum]